MKNDYIVAFLSPGSRKATFQFFTLYSLCAYSSYKGLMSNVNCLFWTSSIGQPKRILLYYMNAWFDRNQWPKMVILVKIVKIGKLQMPVESGEPIAFRFFSFKTFIYYSWTKKTSYRMLPMAAILTKNSIAKWSQSLLSPDGFKPWIFFHLKII